jgi:hypothetical protein
MGARWYDPAVERFISDDTIVPQQYSAQAYDKYAYVNNNPIKNSDPTGHLPFCGICTFWNLVPAETKQDIGRKYFYTEKDKASDIQGLMIRAFFNEPRIELTGQAVTDIAQDKNLEPITKDALKIIDDQKSDYGEGAFDLQKIFPEPRGVTFGETGNMWDDATKNRDTWTVRAASVQASANVSADGQIKLNYTLNDKLDLRPDWFSGDRTGWSGLGYNLLTTFLLGPIWHDDFGASAPEIYASWTTQAR